MKRLLAIMLCLVILLSLAACVNDDIQDTVPSTDLSQSTTDNTEVPTGGTTEPITSPTENTTKPTDEPTSAPTKDPQITPTTKPNQTPTTRPTTCSHSWIGANFQKPKSCAVCGETTGEILTPGMESHNMDVIEVVLGKRYNCITTSSKNNKLKTTGQIVFDDYERFEGNELYEVKEGYEWLTISVDVTFCDAVAKAYGFNLFAQTDDYYTPYRYSGTGGESTNFTVNYCGVEYTDCIAWVKNSSVSDWVDGASTWHFESYWRIPVGYDGVTLVFHDSVIKPAVSEHVWDYADDNTMIFRFGNNISTDVSHNSKISQKEAQECVNIISSGRCGMIDSGTGFTFCITETIDALHDVKSVEILSAQSYGYAWEIYSAKTAEEIEQTLQNDGANTDMFAEFLDEDYKELHILFTVTSPKEQVFESRNDGYGELYIDLLITYRVHFVNGEYVDLTYIDLWNEYSGGGWPLFPEHYEYN